MFTKSIAVSVTVSRMGVVLIKHGVIVSGQYCWDIYLRQGGYVIVIVCLFVCLLAAFSKKFQTDLH